MHILFLTDNFPPEVNAPASRTYEHAREWVKQGCKVTVITCAPNFPKGKVFDGYKNKLFQKEHIDGIEVIRVWTYITANQGFYKRTLDYISFGVSAFLASIFLRRPDIIIGTSPQFFTALSAYGVSLIKWRPWIFEVRDIWPESIKAVGAIKEGRLLRFLEWLEMFLYKRADGIISVTHSFRQLLIERGVEPEKIAVITNGADLENFKPLPEPVELKLSLELQGKFVAGYVGTHGLAHGLETLLEAASIIQEADSQGHIRLILMGDGAKKPELIQSAQDRGLQNVLFLESVSKAEVSQYWALLDMSIIHLKASDLFETVIPSKLFECMAMGIPVLHGVSGESAQIVRDAGCGVVFASENAAALADLIMKNAVDEERMGSYSANAQEAAMQYDRKTLAKQMLDEMRRCAVSS